MARGRVCRCTHGWPGSIVEFHKVIEPLTDPTVHGGRAEGACHYRITHWTTTPRGDHFAAFEQPELFVENIRAFFATHRYANPARRRAGRLPS
ncbi:hydrolase [Mycobacterium haemophilum DSM 44634]